MCAHEEVESRSAGTPIETALIWLGGGQWHELGERHERSTHAIAGVVVVVNAALAWLVAAVVLAASVRWPLGFIVALTLVFGVLVGAVSRAIAAGPARNRRSVLGRVALATVVGVVVGDLAALVLFSGAVDRRIDEQAVRNADSASAVALAAADLQRTRDKRIALDTAVDQARGHRSDALVVARCEYHPTPDCPQTQITGIPGSGPETRTANQLLADSQQELDRALEVRDQRAPELDSQIDAGVAKLAQARQDTIGAADRGLGARWIAMQDLTFASAGALLLRLAAIVFFTLLSLLPLILRLWRGETSHDRHAAARAELDRAEVAADTAIAVKRAEVRAAIETIWAEHQLAQAHLAVEAQAEIDRVQQRRRVAEALEAPVDCVGHDMYLPIAAEAEAASLAGGPAPAALPAAAQAEPEPEPEPESQPAPESAPEPANLPAVARTAPALPSLPALPALPSIPAIPDVTKAAARWIRPLVPTFVARAIDNTAHPLRTARQVFEEVEEMTFSLKRTRKVTVGTEESAVEQTGAPVGTPVGTAVGAVTPAMQPSRPLHQVEHGHQAPPVELAARGTVGELDAVEGALQLPPAR